MLINQKEKDVSLISKMINKHFLKGKKEDMQITE